MMFDAMTALLSFPRVISHRFSRSRITVTWQAGRQAGRQRRHVRAHVRVQVLRCSRGAAVCGAGAAARRLGTQPTPSYVRWCVFIRHACERCVSASAGQLVPECLDDHSRGVGAFQHNTTDEKTGPTPFTRAGGGDQPKVGPTKG